MADGPRLKQRRHEEGQKTRQSDLLLGAEGETGAAAREKWPWATALSPARQKSRGHREEKGVRCRGRVRIYETAKTRSKERFRKEKPGNRKALNQIQRRSRRAQQQESRRHGGNPIC